MLSILADLVVISVILDVKVIANKEEISFENTPFGLWPSDCIHRVDSGSHIDHSVDGLVINGILHTHCGHYSFPSVDSNDSIIPSNYSADGMNPHKINGNGWQAYVKSDMGTAVSSYTAKWAVPPLPQKKESKEELYTFIALQNIDWVPPNKRPSSEQWDVLQPTLSYGFGSATDGGPFWGIASWYKTLTNDVIQSKYIDVEPGDMITGTMQKIGVDSWYINTAVNGDNRNLNTSFTVKRDILKSQQWAYVALQVNHIENCDELPATGTIVPFTDIAVALNHVNQTVEWVEGRDGQNPPICDVKISHVESDEVFIAF